MTLNRKSLAAALIAATMGGAANAYVTDFNFDAGGRENLTVTPTRSNATAARFISRLANPLVASTFTETFEDKDVGATGDVPLNLGGAGRASLKAQNGAVKNARRAGQYGLPGGPKYWGVDAVAGANDAFEIDFGQTMAAFGFYGIDIGDVGGSLSLDLYLDQARVGTVPVSTPPRSDAPASIMYFGLVAENSTEFFNRVVFSYTGPAGQASVTDQMAFDNLTVASAVTTRPPGGTVPEPSTLLLVAGAALGLRLAQRRRA